MSKSVVRVGHRGRGVESAGVPSLEGRQTDLLELGTRVELIQALIPIGLGGCEGDGNQGSRPVASLKYPAIPRLRP